MANQLDSPETTSALLASDGVGAGLQQHDVETPSALSTKGVLNLGKGISLSFQGDSLIVKDKKAAKQQRSSFCGVAVGAVPPQLSIPFYNVLWAEILDGSIVIDHAVVSNKTVRASKLSYTLTDAAGAGATAWIEELLTRAYGRSQRRKRARVIVNPHAGIGDANKIWDHDVKPLFEAARMKLDVTRTSASLEAIGICEELDIDAYDVIIPCSGDGLPYEVINGLGKRADARRALRQLPIAHIPCGSGNALSCNLYGTHKPVFAALAVIKGVRTPMDLMSITQGNRRNLSFLSQSFGIIAEADLGTESWRWMGPMRFDLGVLQRVLTKKVWPCEISIKVHMSDKDEIRAHYKRGYEQGGSTLNIEEAAPDPRSDNGDSVSSDADNGEGLPPLKYGTINDKLPEDWETTSHDKLSNFYCGNMGYMAPKVNFFPAALPNDGLMDLVVTDGDISTIKYAEMLTSLESDRFFHNPLLSYRKIAAYRLTPKLKEGYISIDGERVPFEPFQVEVHQELGTVLSKDGRYEKPGPSGWEQAGEMSAAP